MTPAPSLQELIETVQADAAGADGLERLTVAARTAAELEEVSDSLLGHFVDQCRREGHSWTAISHALGVSKQAAHKRFSLTNAPFERFTERARKALEASADEARGLGHGYIGTEHVLLGLFQDDHSLAASILISMGANRGKILAGLAGRVPAKPALPEGSTPAFTPRASASVAGAVTEALALGHNYVGTEHLLLALLADSDAMAAVILAELTVEKAAVSAEVVRRLSGYTQP